MALPATAPTSIELEPYAQQIQRLPSSGKHVVAHQHTCDSIVVYQAFKPSIAHPAVTHQCFIKDNPEFKSGRMTWIKPGFLWMMYRSGWAAKKDQEHILAVHLNKEWFVDILRNRATMSSRAPGQTTPEPGQKPSTHDVVVQWDPDHDWLGGKLTRRAIQVGLRGSTAAEYAQGTQGPAVLLIEDVTGFVVDMRDNVVVHGAEEVERSLWVPKETVWDMDAEVREVLMMDS
eukprot:CAMPEP_0202896274 /NCGR_PEP_ID=MMETSP1392-20130828/5302_1 /ASSEMBLY_ACC=CAM_ASM_000868 /TAXON_ID=225041 /ORGANISM="Chlamydomonas chlamydogama, Strain SAG 11-48b" /LENGTH=230 /DNA_ID=CAMNT_0049581565 /DNA_START=136 /DNA_END=828 /DNA_ORIENTATION=-